MSRAAVAFFLVLVSIGLYSLGKFFQSNPKGDEGSVNSARLVINEIFYHPPGRNAAALEFVELWNTTKTPINLKGYWFEGIKFRFNEDTSVEAGGFLVVAKNAAYLKESFGVANVVGNFSGKLSNEGETVRLLDSSSKVVDAVTYRANAPLTYLADGFGPSLERVSASKPSDQDSNWRTTKPVDIDLDKLLLLRLRDSFRKYATPGKANSSELFSPKSLVVSNISSKSKRGVPSLEILTGKGPEPSKLRSLNSFACGETAIVSLAYGDKLFPSAKVRRRGGAVCSGQLVRSSLHVKLYGGEIEGFGDAFNLDGFGNDPSRMRSYLSWQLASAIGLTALPYRYVELYENGQSLGLYAQAGNLSSSTLGQLGFRETAALYKVVGDGVRTFRGTCSWAEKKLHKTDRSCSDLMQFIDELYKTEAVQLRHFFESRVDTEALINFMILQVLIENHDFIARNHFWIQEKTSKRWTLLPWDLDFTFISSYPEGNLSNEQMSDSQALRITAWAGTRKNPNPMPDFLARVHPLLDRLLFDVPGDPFKKRYLSRLEEVLKDDSLFSRFNERLEQLRPILANDSGQDSWLNHFRNNVEVRRRLLLKSIKPRYRLSLGTTK